MLPSYTIVEDIIDELSMDLDKRGFSRINPNDDEVVRYAKRDSPNNFEVGIGKVFESTEKKTFDLMHLALDYDLPKNFHTRDAEIIRPSCQLMYLFFRNSPVYHHDQLPLMNEKNRLQGERGNISYCIGVEKEETTAAEMQSTLGEVIDYICDFVTINTQMLTRTQPFD